MKTLLALALPLVALWISGPRLLQAASAPAGPTAASLAQVVKAPRWLSLPQSRLVLNPRIEVPGPTPGFSSPELTLNLAFYVGEAPVALPGLWSWQPQPRAGRSLESGPRLGFEAASVGLWKASGVTPEFEGSPPAWRARLRVADSYGSVSREVTVNLDATPFLVIQAEGGSGGWALKVNDGTQAVDTPLVHDTSAVGTFAADVAQATGWRGTKTFRVVLFAIGGAGKVFEFSRLQFFGRPQSSRLVSRASTWFPHQILAGASSPDGALQVESTVAFLDESTVAQRLTVKRAGAAPLLLSGQFTAGTVRWDSARRALILQGQNFRAVLACSRAVRWLGVRASGLSWATGEVAPSTSSGAWAMALDDLRAGERIVVAARFEPSVSTWSEAKTREAARKMASARRFEARLKQQERAWNRRLSLAPRPLDFAIRAVEPRGVSPTDVRRAYYTAWAFLLCNTLPPMPENHFAFSQHATGKPSLWNEGAPHARPSAQWDSLLAMQAMALVDPESTWDAFEGMMSLVSADGSMNGEGLPSCHAHRLDPVRSDGRLGPAAAPVSRYQAPAEVEG